MATVKKDVKQDVKTDVKPDEKPDNDAKYFAEIMEDVSAQTNVQDSVIKLVDDLSARLAKIANNPSAVSGLSRKLASERKNIAEAVISHTPPIPPIIA